ncbi:MAG: DUF1772 domain-containing protein [Acidobacteria bacterium]|nr:DUF1772 domain-containing protein [Acidobacteriota bacterium]
MNALALARVIAILTSGLVAGILFGDRMGASFARPQLSASSFVQLQQIIHVHFVRIMPPLLLIAIAAGLAWLILLRARRSGAEFWLVAAAAVAMIGVAVLTRTINVPINYQLMTWSIQAPPPSIREIWSRWEIVHTLRTVLWLGAFASEVVALGIFASPGSRTGSPS